MQQCQIETRLLRKKELVEALNQGAEFTVEDVAKKFSIGLSTAQRYLKELCAEGRASRVREGSSPLSRWVKANDSDIATLEELAEVEDTPLIRRKKPSLVVPRDLREKPHLFLLGL